MGTSFDLLDLESGNLVGSYGALSEALVIVRRLSQQHGQSAIDRLGLIRANEDDQELVAAGADLLRLARSPVAA